jgi:hypothetical protein
MKFGGKLMQRKIKNLINYCDYIKKKIWKKKLKKKQGKKC